MDILDVKIKEVFTDLVNIDFCDFCEYRDESSEIAARIG